MIQKPPLYRGLTVYLNTTSYHQAKKQIVYYARSRHLTIKMIKNLQITRCLKNLFSLNLINNVFLIPHKYYRRKFVNSIKVLELNKTILLPCFSIYNNELFHLQLHYYVF